MNARAVVGLLVVVAIVGLLVGGTLALGGSFSTEALGDFRIGGPPPQGDKPGVVVGNATDETGPNYATVAFTFECMAVWCTTNDGLTFRIQQVNRSEFEWDSLYAFSVRDGTTVEVALYVQQRYRLLLKHPDGRIILLGNYVAEADANETVRLTSEMA